MSINDKTDTLLSMYFSSADVADKPLKWSSGEHEKLKVEQQTGVEGLLNLNPVKPHSPITFDMSSDRLYSRSIGDLINPINDYFEDGLEIAVMHEGLFKWSMMKMCRRPRALSCFGTAYAWIEWHERHIAADGAESYFQECFPINKNGEVKPFKVSGWNLNHNFSETQSQMAIRCSMFEDYNRFGAIKATAKIEDTGKAIRFPLPQGSQVDFFKLREAPRKTKSGRLNPIIHYCSEHIRGKSGKNISVKGHWRGTEKITIDGLSLELSAE